MANQSKIDEYTVIPIQDIQEKQIADYIIEQDQKGYKDSFNTAIPDYAPHYEVDYSLIFMELRQLLLDYINDFNNRILNCRILKK